MSLPLLKEDSLASISLMARRRRQQRRCYQYQLERSSKYAGLGANSFFIAPSDYIRDLLIKYLVSRKLILLVTNVVFSAIKDVNCKHSLLVLIS